MIRKIVSPESLGHALREVRKEKGINQTEAGKPVMVDQATVSKIEQGKPGTRLDTLFRLMASLDLELVLQPRQRAGRDERGDTW